MSDEPLVSEILQFGQSDDDCVFEAFKGIHYLQKGYYILTNYGDEWWKDTLNQDIWCDQMIKEEWEKRYIIYYGIQDTIKIIEK